MVVIFQERVVLAGGDGVHVPLIWHLSSQDSLDHDSMCGRKGEVVARWWREKGGGRGGEVEWMQSLMQLAESSVSRKIKNLKD